MERYRDLMGWPFDDPQTTPDAGDFEPMRREEVDEAIEREEKARSSYKPERRHTPTISEELAAQERAAIARGLTNDHKEEDESNPATR